MGQDIFLELDKINTTLLQQAEENVDVTVCSKPSLDSAVAGAGIGALTAGMLAASTIAAPIAPLLWSAAPIGALIGRKSQTVTEHRTVRRQGYSIMPDRYDSLVDLFRTWR